MPHYKCTKCHHEWDGVDDTTCDWCGKESKILEENTTFEKWLNGSLTKPNNYNPGGLYRCCVKHIEERKFDSMPIRGEETSCKYCAAVMMWTGHEWKFHYADE